VGRGACPIHGLHGAIAPAGAACQGREGTIRDPTRIGPDGRDTIALHRLVAGKNAAGARWLIDRGADVNAKRVLWDCNQTALHVFAEHGLVELAGLLLDAGADPGIRDDKYEATCLGWAEYCGQPRIAELLRARCSGVTELRG
jgi:hypothetical protein